jgi:SsrA-binding protein
VGYAATPSGKGNLATIPLFQRGCPVGRGVLISAKWSLKLKKSCSDYIMFPMTDTNRNLIASNKKAFHDYEILEKLEVGMELVGCEVKSIRGGHVHLRDCYARILDNELWLVGCQILPYFEGNRANVDPLRSRKLLIHRHQLEKWKGKVNEKQLLLVPLSLYFLNGKVKLQVGLAKSKKMFDKREVIKERDSKRQLDRLVKNLRG